MLRLGEGSPEQLRRSRAGCGQAQSKQLTPRGEETPPSFSTESREKRLATLPLPLTLSLMNSEPVEITLNGAVYFYRAELEALRNGRVEVLDIVVENLDGDIIEDETIVRACVRDALADFNAEPSYSLPRREWQG